MTVRFGPDGPSFYELLRAQDNDGDPLFCPDCGQQYAREGQPGVDSALRKHLDICELYQMRTAQDELGD